MSVQLWEYKIVYRTRSVSGMDGKQFRRGEDWDPKNIESLLATLGNEGWELVGVNSFSSLGGQMMGSDGPIVAGLATNQNWIFKRPKH